MAKKGKEKENQQYGLGAIKIMFITSFLSQAHNLKSGSDQIQNYWFKSFPDAHRPITINFYSIKEEPEKVPDWPNTGITLINKNNQPDAACSIRLYYACGSTLHVSGALCMVIT